MKRFSFACAMRGHALQMVAVSPGLTRESCLRCTYSLLRPRRMDDPAMPPLGTLGKAIVSLVRDEDDWIKGPPGGSFMSIALMNVRLNVSLLIDGCVYSNGRRLPLNVTDCAAIRDEAAAVLADLERLEIKRECDRLIEAASKSQEVSE